MARTSPAKLVLAVLFCGLAAPAAAQERPELPRVAVLSSAFPREEPMIRAFEERLAELGHVDGETVVIDFRNAQGDRALLDRLAGEVVAARPAVIVAPGPEANIRALLAHTTTIPIVMLAIDYDPVERGLASSYSNPRGNLTGVAIRRVEVNSKRLELLKETMPSAESVTILADSLAGEDLLPHAQAAAQVLGLSLDVYRFDGPAPYDFEAALATAARTSDAVMTLASPVFFRQRHDLFAAAARHHIPVFYGVTIGVADGALMAYGTSFPAVYARAADYVDDILAGADPGDLPIWQADRFELVVNLRVARELGLTIPGSILLRADRLVE